MKARTIFKLVFATVLVGPIATTAFAEATLNVSNRNNVDAVTVSIRRADSPGQNWRKLGAVRGNETGNFVLNRPGTYEVQILDFRGQRRPPTDLITVRDGDTLRIRSSGEFEVRR